MRTVLVIEPDAATRDAIAGLLAAEDLDAACVPDVTAAWQALARGVSPCLVLVEVPLRPGQRRLLDDLLSTGRLRQVPIVATARDAAVARPIWAAALLVKPYDPAELTRALAHCRSAA